MLAIIVNFTGNSDMSSLEYWMGHVEYFVYPVATLLFVTTLTGLSRQEIVLYGNRFGVAGMAIALVSTILVASATQDAGATAATPMPVTALLIVGCMGLGAIIGLYKAKTVQMTGMPGLIVLPHPFVGLAAALVGFNTFMELSVTTDSGLVAGMGFHLSEIGIGIFIGVVTFTGLTIAYLKLSGKMKDKPLTLPGRNFLSVLMLLAIVAMIMWVVATCRVVETAVDSVMLERQWIALGVLTATSLVLGLRLVATIDGGDMPVAVSMLSSYSGWATAIVGFMPFNPLLIIVGALVGSSGVFLSYIMCKGMGRSPVSVILGGFGEDAGLTRGTREYGEHCKIRASGAVDLLEGAKSAVITPGYGMATAGVQSAIANLTKKLHDLGVQVRFGIRPVAGYLPGHMNVLLAEAGVPHGIILEADEVNDDFPSTDVVLVIGANDTVGPDACEPGSPIAGILVLHVWEAGRVTVSKRSMAAGYAGVQNPLSFKENTNMLSDDAKASVEGIIKSPQLGYGSSSGEGPGVATAFSSRLNAHVAPNS